jgi:hypothetical protein
LTRFPKARNNNAIHNALAAVPETIYQVTLVNRVIARVLRTNRMSVSLIVTRSIDRKYNETGVSISDADWKAFIESDSTLALRTESFEAIAPDGSVMRMSVPPGQSEMNLDDGTRIPFLVLSHGELSMRYHRDMEDASHPVRRKVAEIARHFNALIMSDAGDEFLEW